MFQVSEAWSAAFPGAHGGVLAMRDVANPPHHPALARRKAEVEARLRARFSGQDRTVIASLPVLRAYDAYYRRFKKTYHVAGQVESIALKGKALPSGAALVEAMFTAEVSNMLLTAGHDLDSLQLPVVLDVARGDERYVLLRGQEQVLKAGDMMMRDETGVVSSIVHGPDQRTPITAATRNVMFTVYAPAGIDRETVLRHLEDIRQNVLLVAPDARVERLDVVGAR